MPPQLPAAGPSTRVSNFFSDEEGEPEEPVPLVQAKKRKLAVPSANGKKRKGKKDDAGAKKKREEVALELLQKRYELPFYQGRRQRDSLTTGRRMILDEIVKHDTVVVGGESYCLT